MLTQKEIARKLKVSQITVSRVINAHPYVNQKIRAKIKRELERHYVANVNARNLVQNKIGRLGIIIPDTEAYQSYFFTKALHGINDQSRKIGYGVFFISAGALTEQEIRKDIQRGDCFVVVNFYALKPYLNILIQMMREYRKRYILVQSRAGRIYPYVTVDNVEGGRLATSYLLELGHRNIAFAAGEKMISEWVERKRGYKLALEAAHLPAMDKILSGENIRKEDVMIDALGAKPSNKRPSAVFAANDQIALRLIYSAAKRGVKIPENLSIVGFNDFPPIPTMFHPYLTTIRQPLYEIGVEAVRCVFDMQKAPENLEIKLNPVLIERETTISRK